jgi:hypothetical protein
MTFTTSFKRGLFLTVVSICIIILLLIYKIYNPLENDLFPKCIFYKYTGFLCPGCGSQRAIHCLLNFNILSAIKQNILVVLFIPYLTLSILTKLYPQFFTTWKRKIESPLAIKIIIGIILGYWLIRNIS